MEVVQHALSGVPETRQRSAPFIERAQTSLGGGPSPTRFAATRADAQRVIAGVGFEERSPECPEPISLQGPVLEWVRGAEAILKYRLLMLDAANRSFIWCPGRTA